MHRCEVQDKCVFDSTCPFVRGCRLADKERSPNINEMSNLGAHSFLFYSRIGEIYEAMYCEGNWWRVTRIGVLGPPDRYSNKEGRLS